MSNVSMEREYTCYNDCWKCLSGEKHIASMKIQTTADAIAWQDDEGVEVSYFDPNRLEIFLDMLNESGYLPQRYAAIKGEK